MQDRLRPLKTPGPARFPVSRDRALRAHGHQRSQLPSREIEDRNTREIRGGADDDRFGPIGDVEARQDSAPLPATPAADVDTAEKTTRRAFLGSFRTAAHPFAPDASSGLP